MEIIYFILVGIASGFFAGWLMKGKGAGLIINLLLGIVGAVIGGWLLDIFNISLGSGFVGQLLTATLGAVALIFVVNLLRGKK